MPKFTMLTLADSEEDLIIHKLIKMLPAKLYRSYLLKTLPVNTKEASYLGIEANHLVLPFTKKQFINQDLAFIELFMQKLKEEYEIDYAYYDGELASYCDKEEEYQTLLKYIMLPEIIRSVRNSMGIEEKELRLAVIDSCDRRIEYVLELLAGDLNYLTIITPRQEYFTAFKDMIYEDSGLVAEIIESPLKEPISSNIIIDLNQEQNKNYSYYNKDSVIVDIESTKEKRQYLYARRRQYKAAYNMEIAAQSALTENCRLASFLCSEYQLFRGFLNDRHHNYPASQLRMAREIFNLKIRNIIYL